MAYLNKEDRDKLLEELTDPDMTLNKAKRKLRWLDDKIKLRFYRNVQRNDEWVTRYELVGKGAVVTLIEEHFNVEGSPDTRVPNGLELSRVIVEPTPDNRT